MWEAIAGAAAAALGTQWLAGKQSADQAESQRDWEENMSNSAYQRQVQDLAAAGLNPMLGFMKGSGASTPAGAAGSVPHADIAGAVSSAAGASKAAADIDLLRQQTATERERTRDVRLGADLKAGPAAFSESISEDVKRGVDTIRGGAASLSEGLSGLIESSAPSIERVLGSARASVTDSLEVLANLPKRTREKLVSGAKSVVPTMVEQYGKYGKELRDAVIPPSKRGVGMGGMRGKLGSANSWDYGRGRHDE